MSPLIWLLPPFASPPFPSFHLSPSRFLSLSTHTCTCTPLSSQTSFTPTAASLLSSWIIPNLSSQPHSPLPRKFHFGNGRGFSCLCKKAWTKCVSSNASLSSYLMKTFEVGIKAYISLMEKKKLGLCSSLFLLVCHKHHHCAFFVITRSIDLADFNWFGLFPRK